MPTEVIRITCSDGFVLEADLFTPEGEVRGAVLIAPAMAVRRKLYAALAKYLSEAGLVVLAPDYRGVGGSAPVSLRGFPARLRDWGELDLRACLEELGRRAPGVKRLWFGHSVGGQLMGLLEDAPIAGALFVASQSGHHRHWPGMLGPAMWLNWRVLIPVSTALTGKLPMKALGMGEDVPVGVGREWAEWGRSPGYIQKYAKPRGGLGFKSYAGAILSVALADDDYAPEQAVRELVAGYERAQVEVRVVRPEDVGTKSIGHFGAFRSSFREGLWKGWREWLVGRVG